MRFTLTALCSALLLAAPAAMAQTAPVASPAPRVETRVFDDPAPQTATDLQTEVRIFDRLGEMGTTDLSGLRVHAWRGAVLLYGLVPNAAVHDRVLVAVNNIEGVRVVRDETAYGPSDTARGGGPRDDVGLVDRVRGRVASDPGVVGNPLAVRSERGVVVLSGHVATYRDAHRVLASARATPGVVNVRSDLVVNESIVINVASDER